MKSWIQYSDFTSIDIDHLHNFKDFEEFIGGLPLSELDSTMNDLSATSSDWCPWGIGVNMDTDYGFHLCRDDIETKTYSVTFKKIMKKSVFGFIPVSKDQGVFKEGLSLDEVKREVSLYYNDLID